MQRITEITLFIAILVGGVLLWRSSVKRNDLTREHDRLVKKVGRLPIKDPSKIHLQAIETGDPQHFAWRAYFPPNYHYSYSCSSGGGSGSNAAAWEGILRVRIRERDGQTLVYFRLLNGSGLRSFGSAKLSKLLEGQPGRLKVEQLGKDEVVIFDPAEARTLIQISLTPEGLAAAKQTMSEWEVKQYAEELEWIQLGPPGFRRQTTGSKQN